MEEKIKTIQTTLLEKLSENLDTACTKELGEVTDMLKDLEEILYYHTITEAMKQ